MADKKVLIVDDDELVRLVVAKVADMYGAAVVQAKSGEEAMEILKLQVDFDAVFLDLVMPQTTGWDVLKSIRSNEALSEIPVVMLSGAPISDEERAKLGGQVRQFVNKETFSLGEFKKIMSEVLG